MSYQKPPAFFKSQNFLQPTNEDDKEKYHGQPPNQMDKEKEGVPVFTLLGAIFPENSPFVHVEIEEDPCQ